jgi:hypothetical protein
MWRPLEISHDFARIVAFTVHRWAGEILAPGEILALIAATGYNSRGQQLSKTCQEHGSAISRHNLDHQ